MLHDCVGGVTVQGVTGTVVADGGTRVGVAGGLLDIPLGTPAGPHEARTRRGQDQGLPSSRLRAYRSKRPSRLSAKTGREGFARSGTHRPCPHPRAGASPQPHGRPHPC